MTPNVFFPKVMPDELDMGHLGRAMLYLGFESPTQLMTHLYFGQPSERGLRLVRQWGQLAVPVLARYSGTSLPTYIHHHTALPFIRAFAPSSSCEPHGPKHLHLLSQMGDKRSMHFCEQCLEEQREQYGFSYWMRSHQLPGVYWCGVHGSLLRLYHGPLLASPCEAAGGTCPDVEPDAQHSDIVKRYIAGVQALLSRHRPSDASLVVKQLGRLLAGRGIRHQANYHMNCRDALAGQAPPRWLAKTLAHGSRGKKSLSISYTQSCFQRVTIPLVASLVLDEAGIIDLIETP